MKKCIVAIDSFKGTMSSLEACNQAARGILDVFPHADVCCVPVADGGEGTVDAFCHALHGNKVCIEVTGPLFQPIEAEYGLLSDGKIAVIEMAAASGLPLVGGKRNPMLTTSRGTGELILDALKRGCKEIWLGLGGSATNDGGAGVLETLGVKLLKKDGKPIVPTGGGLSELDRIDISTLDERLKSCSITLLCDVDNPLCGENGASAVYGPQKGAGDLQVKQLDQNLKCFAECVKRTTGKDILKLTGGGAAGGIAAGLYGFLDIKQRPGIEALLEIIDFEHLITDADLIVTGEGRLDAQSVHGKVPSGIGRLAKRAGVPAIVLAGDLGVGYEAIYAHGITAAFSINHLARPFSEIKGRSGDDLFDTMRNLCLLIRAIRSKVAE